MSDVRFGFGPDALLVTGAESGIGRAVALRAIDQGLSVSAWDIDPRGLEETVRLAEAASGRIEPFVADVSDREAVIRGVSEATAALGPIRYLHNNAGPPSSVPLDFDRALQLALGSVRAVTEAWAVSGLPPHSAMVVTTSVAGNRIGTESDWYSASKAGLMGYTRHLAAHRAGDFRTNAVAPGMTDTPRLAGFRESETGRRVLARIPLGRMASPDDIACATLFLLSPAASYINGVFLPVDGGWTVTQ